MAVPVRRLHLTGCEGCVTHMTRTQQRQRQRDLDLYARALNMPWTRGEKIFFLVWGLVMIGPLIVGVLLGGP